MLLRRSLRFFSRAAPSLIALSGFSLFSACSKSEGLTSLLTDGTETPDDTVGLAVTEEDSSAPLSSLTDDTESAPPETDDTESEPTPSGAGGSREPSPSGEGGEAAVPTTESSGEAGTYPGGSDAGGSAGEASSADTGGGGSAGSGTTFVGAGGSGGASGTGGTATSPGGSGGVGGTGSSGSGGTATGSSGAGSSGSGGSNTGGSGGAPAEETCVADVVSVNPSASSLVSDFSATAGFTINSCSSVSGGQGLAEPGESPNAGNYCMLKTAVKYDLTCSSVVVKVPERTRSTVGAQTFLYVERSSSEVMVLALEGTAFHFFTDGGPSATGSNYDAVQDLWWRIREYAEAGERQVSFETSPDGASWVERARIPRPFPFDAVTITLGAGTYQNVTTPGRGAFDCYNSVGACP